MVQLERITHKTKEKGRPYLVPAFWHRLGRAMCPRAVWCRGSSGRAMCPRAVWCPGIVQGVPCVRVPSGAVDRQGVPCVRVPFWCPGIVQGVQLATARTPRPCVIEAPKYHRFSELEKA